MVFSCLKILGVNFKINKDVIHIDKDQYEYQFNKLDQKQ